MREVHLNFVYEIDDDDLSDDDAARLAGDLMFDYVSGEVFDSEHPNVTIVHNDEWAPYCTACGESLDTPEGEPCGWCGEPNPRGNEDE